MFSGRLHKQRLLFGLLDLLLVTVAFEAAYLVRAVLPLENEFFLSAPVRALLLGFSLVTWTMMGRWLGVHEDLDRSPVRLTLIRTFQQCALGFVGLVMLEYLLRLDLSRAFLGLFAGLVWLLLAAARAPGGILWGRYRREFTAPHYVLVVGTGSRAERIGRSLQAATHENLRLVGFLSDEPTDSAGHLVLDHPYPIHPRATLPRLLQQHVIDEVVFAVDSEQLPRLEDLFLLCDEEGVKTRIALDLFPHVHSRVSLDRLGDEPLLTFTATPDDEIRLLVKRLTDVILAGTALLVSLPFVVILAVLIRLTSPGPAIFRQVRCGLNGRRFTLYKFRSMCQDAEARKLGLEHLNRKQTAFKIPNDPRLTPIGRWLRKFSLDEWPQLWNVLRGDMSLVGPRPAVPDEVARYERWQRRRLRMRPGLTCLWALNGRDHLDFETWMRMDMEYIDNWSLTLDCKILLRTVPQVLLGRGAH